MHPGESPPSSHGATVKDDWYRELKWAFVQQYIQYLQTLGLCLVQITKK